MLNLSRKNSNATLAYLKAASKNLLKIKHNLYVLPWCEHKSTFLTIFFATYNSKQFYAYWPYQCVSSEKHIVHAMHENPEISLEIEIISSHLLTVIT